MYGVVTDSWKGPEGDIIERRLHQSLARKFESGVVDLVFIPAGFSPLDPYSGGGAALS